MFLLLALWGGAALPARAQFGGARPGQRIGVRGGVAGAVAMPVRWPEAGGSHPHLGTGLGLGFVETDNWVVTAEGVFYQSATGGLQGLGSVALGVEYHWSLAVGSWFAGLALGGTSLDYAPSARAQDDFALLLRPKVLLIDEPSIGLSPMVVQDVFKLLRKLADQGTTVLMVEQNVKSALKYSDDAIALESGRLVLHKPAAEILADPQMDRLFLGGAHTTSAAAHELPAAV